MTETVTVSIYGESYTLRAGDDPEHAREAARYVDKKMREIAAGGKVIDTRKVAIMTALIIADEFLRQGREGGPPVDDGVNLRLDKLISDLNKALEK